MQKRVFEIDIGSIRSETRTVQASLSSEHPVKRFDGFEVLSHRPGSVDLSRSPLPLLRAHDNTALPVGVVEGLTVEGGKLRGTIRLSANQDSLWTDIVDGIIRNLSIGYQITEKKKTKTGFIATRWMPYECSLVAAPADNSVGINRNLNNNFNNKGDRKMDKNDMLKSKKAAIEEMAELAKSGENAERMEELKGEIRSFDSRLEAFDMADSAKKDMKTFTPDIKKEDRLIEVVGGPATNRTWAGMFNQGRKLEVNEEELRAFRASMLEGTPSLGGFSIPEPLAAKWLDESLPDEIIRPRCQVWPMTSASLKVPAFDGNDQSAGTYFGGFSLEFLAEEAAGTPKTGKLRLIELSAKKAGLFVNASSEVIEDGLGFEGQLTMAIKKSLSLGMDFYLLRGLGAGQPLGVLNSPGVISVAKETGQSADSLCYENLTKLFSRMYSEGHQRAIFIANPSTIPQLLTLSQAVGTGGNTIPVMTKGVNGFEILGRPVVFSSNMPPLGDANDICYVDLSAYAMGLRRDLRIEKSIIPGWTTDVVSYRVLVRFDGCGTWSKVLTPRNGATQSWCVGLAERA